MSNRLTFHGGYRNANGKAYNSKHNQRENFTKPKEGENVYWDYVSYADTFSGSEREFYKSAFGDHVKHQNEKYKKSRHPERCKTIDQYRADHPPEEVLLYIGTENVNPYILGKVFEDFRKYAMDSFVDNEKGCGIEILNAALHMDEKTPHIQFRQVYYYTDKNGDFQVSQTKALAGLGIERPDPTSKESRMNNAKQTFTAICREKLFEIARSYGVELTTEPLPKTDVGLSIDEFRAREQAREAWAKEREDMEEERENLLEQLAETNAQIENNRTLLFAQQLQLKDREEYNNFQRQKAKERLEEQAKQEAQKQQEQREEIKRHMNEQLAEENAREAVRIASETTRSIQAIPDTPKPQMPLKNDPRRVWNDLHNAAETVTAEEGAKLLNEYDTP